MIDLSVATMRVKQFLQRVDKYVALVVAFVAVYGFFFISPSISTGNRCEQNQNDSARFDNSFSSRISNNMVRRLSNHR
jgi:hypothetical protein